MSNQNQSRDGIAQEDKDKGSAVGTTSPSSQKDCNGPIDPDARRTR